MDTFGDRYYRDSGAVPFGGTLLMLVCGIVTAVVLACVYAFLSYHNPFVYISFLGTAFFGLVTGGAVTFGSVLGKVRNPFFTRLVGLFVAAVALYCCWAFYLWALLLDNSNLAMALGLQNAQLSFDPARMASLIQLINKNGLWSMFGGTPTGLVLYALWAVEAIIIVGAIILVAGGSDAPFCESCNDWTDETADLLALEKTDFAELRNDLEAESYSKLNELNTGEHDPADCLCLTLHTCPKCEEANYLTIKHTKITIDKEGDEQKEETDVVNRLAIPVELVERLQTAAEDNLVSSATETDNQTVETDDPDADDERPV